MAYNATAMIRISKISLILCGVLLLGGCQWRTDREKAKHREVYAEYLQRVQLSFNRASSINEYGDNYLPTDVEATGMFKESIEFSNHDSKRLIKDLDLLKALEPLDDHERKVMEEITLASLVLNYYLSYRIMGPTIFMSMKPETIGLLDFDKVHDKDDMEKLLARRLVECHRLLDEW